MADAARDQRQHQEARQKKPRSLLLKLISFGLDVLGFLLLAYLLSVVVEWIGMLVFWPDLGAAHSEQMLRQELGYLTDDFATSITGSAPALIAFDAALAFKYYLFEWTHLIDLFEWLKAAPPGSSELRHSLASIMFSLSEYIQAWMNTSVIFALRVTVATLALPAFVLVGLAAIIDGLVQRELRIYGGGLERAMVYHHAKPWIKPSMFTAWFIYLSIPISVHPNLIFVPAMALFGLAIFITAALFKKHL